MKALSSVLIAPRPDRLSRELRRGRHGFLPERRGIVSLALAAAGCIGVVALYQMGVIRRLPDVPGRRFDAARVDATPDAYRVLQMGDAFIGLNSYAITAALAAMGGTDRTRRHPWIPLLLAAKALVDAGVAAGLTYTQWAKCRAFCIWCLAASAATFATVPLAAREATAAARYMSRQAKRSPSRTHA